MKILRFENPGGRAVFGKYEDGTVLEIEGDVFGEHSVTDRRYGYEETRPLPPCLPTKIIAVGLNYGAHAAEMKKELPEEPMLFMKPSTAVIAHGDEIEYPAHMSERVDYEGELAVVMGKKTRMVEPRDALGHVFGYTCVNDVTARDLQAKDVQFTRGKGFDTFAPLGPFIETDADPGGPPRQNLPERRASPGLLHRGPGVRSGGARELRLQGDDPSSRGRDSHGNSRGRRPHEPRGRSRGRDRGSGKT